MGTVHNKGLREGIVVGNCCEVWRFWGGDERLGRKRRDCSIVMAAFHSLTCFFFLARSECVAGCIDRGWEKNISFRDWGGTCERKKRDMGYGLRDHVTSLYVFF